MRIENLCLSYGSKAVLKDLSCDIEGLTCITGPSGCGKTTLLRCIASLIQPDSGSIINAPKRPSFMFQDDRLFPWYTALQNVMTVTDDKEKALHYLNETGLSNEINSLPDALSGGMRRRVALARALAFDSDMLILDEPFKGMDHALIERLVPLIKRDDIPVIVATHSADERELLGGNIITLE